MPDYHHIAHVTKKVASKVLLKLPLNLSFPLISTIYDFWTSKTDTEARKKIHENIKTPGMIGAVVGTGLGIALCSPKGLMSVTGLKVDGLPIDKMSDLFPQINGMDGFHGADGLSWNTFLCILTIAATTIVCKAMFAEAGVQYWKKTDPGLAKALPTGTGIIYGIFSNSADDLTKFKKWLFNYCSEPRDNILPVTRKESLPKHKSKDNPSENHIIIDGPGC